MSIYTYNGLEFSEEDVIAKAEEKGLDLDSYINEFGIKRKEDKVPGKPKPAVKKGAVAAVKSTVSKSASPSLDSLNNPFGKVKQIDPLGIQKLQEAVPQKPAKAIKPTGQAYKYDSRGYLVPKDTKEPSLWDDAIDFAKNLFPDSEENSNGKLTYYEQTPLKEQQATFKKDSKDALNAVGKFEFLKDYKPEDRALFVSKLLPKTNYTEKRYNQQDDSYEIVPKQEAVDYIMKDIEPNKFKTKAQLDAAISLNTKKLAAQDSSFEFEQQYAKSKAAPLINSKIAEIKKKYSLNTAESVAKATKELQDYAAKTTTDFLINSNGFQSLNQTFAAIEDQAKNTLTKQYERSKEFGLSAYDTVDRLGQTLEKGPGLISTAGTVTRGVAKLAEGAQKGLINIGTSGMQTAVSAKQGEVNSLNDFYTKYKDHSDNEKFNLPETWNDLMAGAEGIGQVESLFGNNVPKTFGEARKRLKEGVNKINSDINSKVTKIADTKEYVGLFNEADLKDGVQLNDVFTLVGEQVPNIGLTTLGAATGNPLLVGLSTANVFTQEYGSQYYDTIETGLKEDLGRKPTNKEIAEAIGKGKYANRAEIAAGAAISAGLEYASELNIIKNTGRALGLGDDAKAVLGSLFRGEIKNFSKSMVQQGVGLAKSGIGEYLTESLQQGISQASKGIQLQGDATKYIDFSEINEAGKAGGLIGFVFPFAGTVATQTGIELRTAATKVATTFDLSNKNMSNLAQVDQFFKAASQNIEERFKIGDLTAEQKQSELETLGTIRSSGTKIPADFASGAKEKAIGLMLEKANIEKAIDGKDKDLVTPEVERLKAISTELATIAIGEKERIRIESNKETLDTGIESIKNIVDKDGNKVYENAIGAGKSVEVFETAVEAQAAYDKWALANNKASQDITLSDGFALPNGQILINKERAAKVGALNVAPHELLHNILKSEFSDPKRKVELKDKFLSVLSKAERAKLDNRILALDENGERLYSDKDLEDAPDEYMTQYFELLGNGTITWSDNVKETLISLWDSVIKPIFVKQGFKNIEFEDGRDIYNFIKDYAKTIKKGKLSERASELLKAGEDISGVTKFSKTKIDEIQKKIDNLEDQLDTDEIDYDTYENRLKIFNEELKKAKLAPEAEKPKAEKPKIEVTEEDEVKEIIKNEKGSVASDKVQKIYETKGLNGAQDIIDLFKPITKKIVDKRRDAPGFDRQLLTDEVETGVGGILDLIRTYDPSKGAPLAAYINKQLPLRAIASSKRVLDKQFNKDAAEEVGLMATETADERFAETEKEKPKYKNALESKVLEPDVLKTISNKILTNIRTLKTRIDAPISLNRTVTPLIAEIRDAMGKQLDIDLKTAMGGKKDNQLRSFALKNKKYFLENMTTTFLMGADGKGGVPQAIQKQVDGKWTNYPDWVGKKIDREKTTTDNAGRTSGAEMVRRLPNAVNNVSDADYLGQLLESDGNPIRGRKESWAKAMAEEIAFDIINTDFLEDGPIFEAFKVNQERQGVEVASNTITDFIRQAERGNIKFSKQRMQELNLAQVELANNISVNGKMGVNNIRLALITTFPEWNKEDIDYVATKLAPSMISAFKQIKTERKKLPKDLLIKAIENVVNSQDDGVTMRNKFGSKISVAAFFRNPQYRADLKTLDLAFSEFILKKYGKKEGLDILSSLWSPTVAGKTSSGKKAPISIYDGVNDFNTHLEALQRNADSGKLIDITQTYKKNNAVFNNNFDGTFIQAKDKLKSDKAKEVSILAAEWFSKEILKEDNNYGPEHLAAIYTLLIKENNSVLRSAAPVVGTIMDKRIKNIKKYDYDHSKPVSYVGRRLADKFVYGLDVDLDLLFKDYEVTIIPKVISSKLAKLGLQSMMPINYIEGSGNAFRIKEATSQDIERYENFINNVSANYLITNKAVTDSMKLSKTAKGISVFDFDDTVGLTEGNVLYTMPDGSKGKLNAEEFAKEGSRFLEEGAVFDFSEFSKVVGGKPGPMVEKMKKMIGKFGPDNFFILTARPANAAGPIHEFLSSIGIDIPLENITGLGNSAAQAKADWMVGKAAEGYNDFYFSDDAIQNVKAVKDALDVLDVKSKIQQARLKFSKTISPEFNKIIEQNTGMEDFKVFSDIVARRRGTGKNRFDFYVPASAADFELLLYKFIGKGTLGEEQKKFFDDALLKPYANGNDLMDAARQSIKKDYKALTDIFPGIKKTIESLTPDGDFTYDQAIRVAMWNEEGVEIPGISQRDSRKLTDLVNADPELKAFKEGLIVTGRQGKGWVKPENFWDANTIISDLHNLTEGEGKKKFLAEFIENAELMFGKWEQGRLVGPNINKVEAVYGTNVREAIEDVLWRMTTGKNRGYGKDKETGRWANWVNGSTGTIMFLNTRSAALQLIGAVNFLNLRDNNPFAAAMAFANQKQYWTDFAYIWNSDKIKERRGGLKEDVAAAEVANAAASSTNKANAVISYLLKVGYTPTQLADSFAIASGGAPYYRNRIKTYLSEGLSEQEAETKAWSDFTKVADETQQSGDPRDISKQQASGAGRLLLTFQNTAMQQSRIVKKSFLDLKNGRGDAKTNVAKIIYYLGVQNVLFAALQQGLIAVGFGFLDDEEDEAKKKALEKEKDKKVFDITNGVVDTILSGTGFVGKVVVTLKNMAKVYLDERDKNFKADYAKVVLEAANISPPIGSKLRKLYSGLQQTKYDKDLIKERGWGVMQDGRVHLGPMYSVAGKVVEAGTNVPLDRLATKIENASQAMNSQNEAWQRVMIGLGFNPYSLGVKETKGDVEIEAKAKEIRKEEGLIKAKETRERTKDSIRSLPREERRRLKKEDLLKRREKKIKKRKMG